MGGKVKVNDLVQLLKNYSVDTADGHRKLPIGTVLRVTGRSYNGGCRHLADPSTGEIMGLFIPHHFEKIEEE